MSALADHGIHIRRERSGEHRATCPRCAETKIRPRDDALAVRVDADGSAMWVCHRCAWKGTTRTPGSPQERRKARGKGSPPAKPESRPASFSGAPAALWRSSYAITDDCPAGRYLAARGCASPHPEGGLRWHPELRHPSGHVSPALLALVTDAVTGESMTLHRTWLRADGTGKADLAKPRLLWLGLPKAGGVVRLWPDAEVTLGLCVAEGIETTLTAAAGFGLAWSTIDKKNLEVFPILPGIEALTIVADHDEDGGGQRAAEECGRRWLAAGVEVRIWMDPTPGADFNDHARAVA
jgi:hypothetical protein